ncbi:MAG: biotin--[acetyl-CoA-carboxylase] ligase [Dehalococcoidia bacterium]|jgi:BirA family biotin operon repressor/biotin-[acetyl-CoA-carboxylase] ligase
MEENILSAESIRDALNTKYIGRPTFYYPSVSSTMDVARQSIAKGASEGTVVLADEQTSGRGRLRREWVSPPDSSLTLSIILYPKLVQVQRLTMAACIAIARCIEDVAYLENSIKWPNDVLINDKKVSGVLIESDVAGDNVNYAIVGIALNVNLDVDSYPEIAAIATSLKRELGLHFSRLDVLASLLAEFEAVYNALCKGEPIQLEWKRRLKTLGQNVTVRCGDVVRKGVAEDVDDDGNLLLRLPNKKLEVISAGDVTLKG